jgi:hypothetical protein
MKTVSELLSTGFLPNEADMQLAFANFARLSDEDAALELARVETVVDFLKPRATTQAAAAYLDNTLKLLRSTAALRQPIRQVIAKLHTQDAFKAFADDALKPAQALRSGGETRRAPDDGPAWADLEAGAEACKKWPEVEAYYRAEVELALTLHDAPGETATRAEAEAWGRDMAQAKAGKEEAWSALRVAIDEGRVDLTVDERDRLGEAFAPLWAVIYPPADDQEVAEA